MLKDGCCAVGMDYFDCREVLEILKRVDGDSKSLFGQFTAPRVKVCTGMYCYVSSIICQINIC